MYRDFEITVREVIASLVIICVFILGGIAATNGIVNSHNEKAIQYNVAIQIDSDDMFKYALDTKVGNILAYGTVEAIDPITIDGYGPYGDIKRVEEHYEPHTETYTVTDSDGETHTETKIVWDWEHYQTDYWQVDNIKFLGQVFPYDTIHAGGGDYIDTVKFAPSKRYKYYATDVERTGTIFANTVNGNINGNKFFSTTIENVVEDVNTYPTVWIVLVWILIVIVMIFCLGFFYQFENEWLEDDYNTKDIFKMFRKRFRKKNRW